MAKKQDATSTLVSVIGALEPLNDTERQWVIQSAASRFALSAQPQIPGGGVAHNILGAPATPQGAQPSTGQLDPKTFMKLKNPQSETQRITCLAYYLSHNRDTPAFKTAEITKLNTEARGPRFNVARAVANASNARHGYLAPIGKGQKQITAHGEDIVDALPDLEAVKQAEANRKVRRVGRKSGRKRRSKAA